MENLDELFSELDLGNMKRYARYIHACCPFHPDSHPSFFIYPDKYFCSSCGARGNTSTLLNRLKTGKTVSTRVSSEYIYNPWKNWLKHRTLDEICRLAYKNLPSAYLRGRGIPEEAQQRLRLGVLENWVVVPIYKNNLLAGAVARSIAPNSTLRYVIPAGQDPNLLYVPDWVRIETANEVFVIFGIIDAISLYLYGYATISTTTGLRTTSYCFSNIRKPIYIIPDAGEEMAAQKLASNLDWRGKVLRFPYPPGTKDINDVLIKQPRLLLSIKDMTNGK